VCPTLTSGAPSKRRFCSCRLGGIPRTQGAQAPSAPPQVAGAPGPSHLGTGDTTNPKARKRRLPHRRWRVPPVPRIWGPGIQRTPRRASAVCPTAGGGCPRSLAFGDRGYNERRSAQAPSAPPQVVTSTGSHVPGAPASATSVSVPARRASLAAVSASSSARLPSSVRAVSSSTPPGALSP